MTKEELDELLTATLAAALPQATAEAISRFCALYAQYRLNHSGNGALLAHARQEGFLPMDNGQPPAISLPRVIAAINTALRKAEGKTGRPRRPDSGGDGGSPQRQRG